MASEEAAVVASIISNDPCLFAPPLTNHLQQQPQLPDLPPPAKKKRNLPGTPGKQSF
jgi:hypothetical protein